MNIFLKRLGGVDLIATPAGLTLESEDRVDWKRPETWPANSQALGPGRLAAYEIASMLEMGIAETRDENAVIPYENFESAEVEGFRLHAAFVEPSPLLLKIDRRSDIGRSDFSYRYKFLLGSQEVPIDRVGYFCSRSATGQVFKLDGRMYEVLEAMDVFNDLLPPDKTFQRSWLDFAKIKNLASELNAVLDGTLFNNDVVVPSTIGLDLYEDEAGALSFVPTCPELDNDEFRAVFERNKEAQGFYSLDQPRNGKIRIVLSDRQLQVVQRMKRVHRVMGPTKESLKSDPRPVFDGVAGDVDLPYWRQSNRNWRVQICARS